jgi:hypothetical protein
MRKGGNDENGIRKKLVGNVDDYPKTDDPIYIRIEGELYSATRVGVLYCRLTQQSTIQQSAGRHLVLFGHIIMMTPNCL